MKTLKIIFCILSCLCVAASVLAGVFFGWEWFLLSALLAVLFGAAMFFVKKKSEPQQPSADFMNSDSVNEETGKDDKKQ